MQAKSKTPHEGGALRKSFGGCFCSDYTDQPVHRQAALALLVANSSLSHKQAGFLGHVCVARELSRKQRAWLDKLLSRHGLPTLADGGGS